MARGHLVGDLARQCHTIGHRRALDRHEGDHVHGTEARVFALVLAEVDGGDRLVKQRERRGLHLRAVTGVAEDGPVMGRVGFDVQQLRAGRADRRRTRVQHVLPSTVTDIGNTFDDRHAATLWAMGR